MLRNKCQHIFPGFGPEHNLLLLEDEELDDFDDLDELDDEFEDDIYEGEEFNGNGDYEDFDELEDDFDELEEEDYTH